LVEQLICNQQVVGSSPTRGSKFNSGSGAGGSASGLGPEGRRFESCLPDIHDIMKAILKFDLQDEDDRIEHQMMLKAKDMSIALWDISQELRKKVKYASDDLSQDKYEAYEEIQEMFYNILNQQNIDLDL
jgi:hypothetical protein